MNYHPPGLRQHLTHKRASMQRAAQERPSAGDWNEVVSAQCIADDFTGVRKLSVRDWQFIGDGGPSIGGNDLGPTSPELFCGVVSTCFTHALLCLAATREIPLDRVEVEVSANNNDANFFGVPSDLGWVPTGLTIDAQVKAAGVEAELLQQLVADAEATCPIMQLIRQPGSAEVRAFIDA